MFNINKTNMDRGLRRKKSERARTRRSRLKEVVETVQQRLHKRLKNKRVKLSKIKKRHHDGKL
jgi:hypothetical protein